MKPSQQTKLLLVGLAEYLQTTLTAEQVKMYAEEFPNPAVLGEAIKLLKKDPDLRPGRFPLPAQLHRYLQASAESDGKEVAALIFEAMNKFGENRQHEAKAFMGPTAWEIAKRYGGFGSICNMESREKSTIYAQIRDLATNTISRTRMGLGRPELEFKADPPPATRITATTESMSEVMLRLIGRKDDPNND